MEILGLIVVMGIGLLMAFSPELMFTLEHFFTVKDGEPSEYYITVTRLRGIVLFLLAFVFFVWFGLNKIDFYAWLK